MRTILRASAAVIILSAQGVGAASITNPTFGPVQVDSGSFVRILPNDVSSTLSDGDQSGSRTDGNATVSYRTNQALGQTGVAATTTGAGNTSAVVRLFDTLSFDFGDGSVISSGLVEFSLKTEGTISNLNGRQAVGVTSINLADITGLDTPFFIHGEPGSSDPRSNSLTINSETEERILGSNGQEFVFKLPDRLVDETGQFLVTSFDASATCRSGQFAFCQNPINTNGAVFDVDYTLNGSFFAQEGREYALEILSFASVVGSNPDTQVTSDFLGTSTFRFDNLSGATAFSASGLLPGTQPAPINPVPIPASLPLMLVALGSIGFIARRRQNS